MEPNENLKAAEDHLSKLILELQKTATHQEAKILRGFAQDFARFKPYALRMIENHAQMPVE